MDFVPAGTGTDGGLEPDACRLLRHLSYARTTLDFDIKDAVLMGVTKLNISVRVQEPSVTSS